MRIVLQKVSQASVTVDSQIISNIKHGYMLLVGISIDDTIEDIKKLSNKVLTLRLYDDNENSAMWKQNIQEAQGEILSVSQFTLYARTKKGTKPDFHLAQKGHIAQDLYNEFLLQLRGKLGDDKVQDGKFGAMMSCALTNEGPVTIILDSNN
ncbi:similar to Saccharomyces cerevisiae YDL219W DTD1 D-Tyr-tRNA(Tyr) deacylase [Maudiozyma saulgeensis]|uniref:D-aminoacyl-tRNA deacylase n=1 Tax=Maudiozyma saulgeensis TaxID=1789683 RepID=A0A1X7R7B4_9SACH|nr:similar to Saccharomyces cerevisiae YDL219W DTD1 D-Tyr-tRNA(Tyr) deacylase [Kazachstania saulgeensis]